jgi:hypothetical protein
MNVFSSTKKNLTEDVPNEEKLKKIDLLFNQLQSLFKEDPKSIYLDLIKYIKFREMREYLERKKKSKFVRYRRNDEKIKKIYKHLMLHIYTNFKENELETSSNFSLNQINLKLDPKSKSKPEIRMEPVIKLGKKSLDIESNENKVNTFYCFFF